MLWESRSQDIVDVETLSRLNQERIGLQIASIDVIQRNCDDFDVQKRQLRDFLFKPPGGDQTFCVIRIECKVKK